MLDDVEQNITSSINEERLARIQQITQQLEDLATELNRLIIEEGFINRDVLPAAAQVHQEPPELAINQRVEITNNYNRLRGARGTITAVSDTQVWVRIDGHRRSIRKKKTNVRIIEEI